MNEQAVAVTVNILDKEYRVSCRPDEQEGLIESARLLDQRMREIYQAGRVVGTDRIAVIAALNIAHELLQMHENLEKQEREIGRRLHDLQKRLAVALAEQGPDNQEPIG